MNGRPRVLLVEDDPYNRDLLRRLVGAHYDVEEAGDGKTAYQMLCERPVDVIVTDLTLPLLSGLELLELALQRDPRTVGVLISGYEHLPEQAQRTAASTLVFAKLTKPYDTRELLTVVRRAVDEATRRKTASG